VTAQCRSHLGAGPGLVLRCDPQPRRQRQVHMVAPAHGATFVLAQAAPNPGGLARGQCPRPARDHHRAAPAHSRGSGRLDKSRPAAADGKEQFRFLHAARRSGTPIHIHVDPLPGSGSRPAGVWNRCLTRVTVVALRRRSRLGTHRAIPWRVPGTRWRSRERRFPGSALSRAALRRGYTRGSTGASGTRAGRRWLRH